MDAKHHSKTAEIGAVGFHGPEFCVFGKRQEVPGLGSFFEHQNVGEQFNFFQKHTRKHQKIGSSQTGSEPSFIQRVNTYIYLYLCIYIYICGARDIKYIFYKYINISICKPIKIDICIGIYIYIYIYMAPPWGHPTPRAPKSFFQNFKNKMVTK